MTPVAARGQTVPALESQPGRKRWRPSWWMVARVGAATIVVGFALYATLGFVLASEALTVTRITVQGNQRMSRGKCLDCSRGCRGQHRDDRPRKLEAKLLDLSVGGRCVLRRMFPGTLAIVIETATDRHRPHQGPVVPDRWHRRRGRRVRSELFRPGSANRRRAHGGEGRERIGRRSARGAGRPSDERAGASADAGRTGSRRSTSATFAATVVTQRRHRAAAGWR